MATPVLDAAGAPRVCFAGEATSRHHPSTTTGAYLSGIREAMRIDMHARPHKHYKRAPASTHRERHKRAARSEAKPKPRHVLEKFDPECLYESSVQFPRLSKAERTFGRQTHDQSHSDGGDRKLNIGNLCASCKKALAQDSAVAMSVTPARRKRSAGLPERYAEGQTQAIAGKAKTSTTSSTSSTTAASSTTAQKGTPKGPTKRQRTDSHSESSTKVKTETCTVSIAVKVESTNCTCKQLAESRKSATASDDPRKRRTYQYTQDQVKSLRVSPRLQSSTT